MFNNANVIFRTKFIDGVSTVTRTIGTRESFASQEKSPARKRSFFRRPSEKEN
jgi:structural maintenance of chromosome 2